MAQTNGGPRDRLAPRPDSTTRTFSSMSSDRRDAEAWRPLAACRDVDSDLFFPIGSTGNAALEIERAKAVCADCPVQRPCLAFAIVTNQEFGVWGGRDERERPALRRQWRAAAGAGRR